MPYTQNKYMSKITELYKFVSEKEMFKIIV